MNLIALSFDIEDWYHSAPISGSSISKYKSLEDFLSQNRDINLDCITEATIRVLDILDEFGIKATFFVVADVALRYTEITKRLRDSKHEIASHSHTHQSSINSRNKRPLKSLKEWINDQVKAKRILEDIFNREVIGFRSPNAYFANWMVEPLYEIGFKYDSSIAFNSIYNKTNVVLRNIPTYPYRMNSNNLGSNYPDMNLVELPWSYYQICQKLRLPAGGGYFFRLLGYPYFKKVLLQALEYGDTMFYLHPLDISMKRIREFNSKNRPGYWINKGRRTERNLIKLLATFKDRFCTCQEVYERFVFSQDK